MKKRTAVICMCFLIVCMFVGIVISGFFQREIDQQLNSAREIGNEKGGRRNYSERGLTDIEKEEVIKIALNDTEVKEILEDKEYKLGTPFVMTLRTREGVLLAYPTVEISIPKKSDAKLILYPLVDLEKREVIQINYRYSIPPITTEEMRGEEREEAIKIALGNESVKEKTEGLRYEIVRTYTVKNLMTGKKYADRVKIHLNGTTICYDVSVNLTKKEVTGIEELPSCWTSEEEHEKIRKASRIARNDPRIREKIKGMEMRKDYEVHLHPKMIGKKFVVDVKIEIKEPEQTILAVVDPDEEKVLEISEST